MKVPVHEFKHFRIFLCAGVKMTALRSTSMRALSPHRTLLATFSHPEAAAADCVFRSQGTHHLQVCSSQLAGQTAAISTSCPHCSSDPQPTYMPSKSTFRKDRPAGQRFRVGQTRGPQQQSVSKVLQQVQLSNWAKSSLSSVFNGLGAFAANTPNRLAEEVSRLVGRAKRKPDAGTSVKDSENTQIVAPVEDTETTKHSVKAVQMPGPTPQREQHTLEQSIEDTNQGISSFFHAYTLPQYVPAQPKKVRKPEEEVSWNVFRKIPIPFMDSTAATPTKKKPLIRKDFVSRSAVEARTKALVSSLKTAVSYSSKLTRTQDLCRHLKQYPSGRHDATQVSSVLV